MACNLSAREVGEIFRVYQGVVSLLLTLVVLLCTSSSCFDRLADGGGLRWTGRSIVPWKLSVVLSSACTVGFPHHLLRNCTRGRVAPACISERATVSVKVMEGGRGAARTAVGRYSSGGMLRERYRRAPS
ncbi:hypothetical protein V8C26DRAFT_8663 [Trichoderma gracile]